MVFLQDCISVFIKGLFLEHSILKLILFSVLINFL